ncbi:MAG: hypothetical protein V3S64_07030 [bacterium]
MTIESRRVISGDHPSLPHHFPGDPVVPGVVILSEVARIIGEHRPGVWISGIRRVKFTAPLRPDQAFTVKLSFPDAGAVHFECRSAGGAQAQENLLLAQGHLLLTQGNLPPPGGEGLI